METVSLAALCATFPIVDAFAADRNTIRLLLSDASDPAIPERRAAVVDYSWTGDGVLVAELSGAHRFVVPSARQVIRVMTAGGLITSVSADGHTSEAHVVKEEEGPLFLGMLTALLATHDALYVTGMSRQLYSGSLDATGWRRADDGLVDRTFSSDSSALYDCTQAESGDLVAVGGNGDIWRRRREGWIQIESGTNVMLNGVCSLGLQGVVACGVGGVLLRLGNDDDVEFIDQPFGEEFLSAIRPIGGSFVVVAPSGLHRFAANSRIEYVGPVSEASRIRLLSRSPENLWAIGPTTLGRSDDGTEWEWQDASKVSIRLRV